MAPQSLLSSPPPLFFLLFPLISCFIYESLPPSLPPTNPPSSQTIISLLPLLLSPSSPTLAQSSAPSAYLSLFLLPDCPEAGTVAERERTRLSPPGACVGTLFFTSFRVGLGRDCPAGQVGQVTVFSEAGCGGASLVVRDFPQDHSSGQCTEFVVSVAGGTTGTAGLGGNSARLECV